jgi:putative NADH-flavin reductase
MKKVTVFDAEGFVGSQVVKEFKNRGYQVTADFEKQQHFNVSDYSIEVRHRTENGKVLISMNIPLKKEIKDLKRPNFKKKFIFNNNNL